MDCKEFSNLLDAYMDGALPDAEANRLKAHAAECDACASLLSLRMDCRRLDEEIQVPDAFSSSWRQAIREEEAMEEKPKQKKNWKAWIGAAAALVFVLGGTLMTRDEMLPRRVSQQAALSTASGNDGMPAAYKRSADATESNFSFLMAETASNSADGGWTQVYEADELEMAPEEDAAAAGQTEKIIRNASFTIKTTHYDADLQQIQDLTASFGGRVEYLSSSGDASSGQTRSASLTLRVPAARLDEFLSGAQGIGSVTAMTQEMQDVSDSYYDIQTRLQTQKEKLSRLQSMMQSAQDVSDLIEIESAIADAQYYIDRYTGQIKSYDSRVDYSTVRVTVRETRVAELKEVTLGQRILSGLRDSLENGLYFLEDMAVFIVSALPWLAAVGIAVAVVRLIIKKKKKNQKG